MIDFLRGKPVLIDSDSVVLEVRDIGYRVYCPNPYLYARESESPVTIYIHYHVREDAVQLFGFATREEQSLFRRLIDVTGIGPRVALGVLSGGTPERIAEAIRSDDTAFLTRLPGIGKKTAQRLVLDLKDKLDDIGTPYLRAGGDTERAGGEGFPADAETGAGLPAAWKEAKEALLALGYTDSELERVRRGVLAEAGEGDGAEKLVKLALKSLYKA